MSLGGGRAQGSVHMFLICHCGEQGWGGQEGRELIAAAAAGKFGFREAWKERVPASRGGTWGQEQCHGGGGSRW